MLDFAEVYDIEVFPNAFILNMEMFNSDFKAVWEISEFRDDRQSLLEHFQYLNQNQIPMIGFNSVGYDYPIIHMLWKNPNLTYQQIFQKSKEIVGGGDRFGHTIWASDRFAPQIDVYKIHHFDNKAKATGLKTLQINMRSPNVVEYNASFDEPVTDAELENGVIPYGRHDVSETKKFAHLSRSAIDFRIGLIPDFGIDVLNWNDTKIGEQMVINRLGDELCYDRSSGRRQTRQTKRSSIHLGSIILPYIKFSNLEFYRIYSYLFNQVLTPEQVQTDDDGEPTIKTKGVFKDLKATVGGVEYVYGIGGIHGSIEKRRVIATPEYPIRDIDVAALYPSIAIVNNLYPEHLGQRFAEVYKQLPAERKQWQKTKGKKCVEANALKLASNGVYGKSNSVFSPFYDPQYMMQITINGQLSLSMLIEWLNTIPTLQVIQANTDGVTYQIHYSYLPQAQEIEKQWQAMTKLVLEDVSYSKMFIKDVNNYIGVGMDGSVKLKGAYWTPDPLRFNESISESQPAAWFKNFSNVVSVRAAVAHMVDGVSIESYIRSCFNPYDFLCAVKVRRSDQLMWGEVEQQRNTRFYVSTDGASLYKRTQPKGQMGAYKKANGVSDAEYERIMRETNGAWDARVCTGNKSRYDMGETSVMAGYNVRICNNINDFDWLKINYNFYLQEAQKLVI
jgi:hypothetical protein